MRISRFYVDLPLAAGGAFELPSDVAHHLVRVLRSPPGSRLRLFNGQGQEFEATLTTVSKRSATVTCDQALTPLPDSPLDITLYQAVSKGERLDYAIQKATELGVTRIQLLQTERVDVRLSGDRLGKKLQHWQRVAIAAAEQCGRACVPGILPVMTLPEWFEHTKDCSLRLVLHHRTQQSLDSLSKPSRVALMVGPEGGLSPEEITAAETAGFLPVALGPRVLRTETAPVAAMALCQWLWGDIGS